MERTEGVFDLLADDYARAILVETNRKPMSAKELAEALDAHHTTIYRRIEQLERHGLVSGRGRIDPDGHHYTAYENRLRGASIDLDDSRFEITLRIREDPAERMATMWREIRGEEP